MSLSIDLSDEERRRLEAAAARTGRPAEDLIHEAIVAQLDEIDEIAWAERATLDWRASDQKTRPISEIRHELGL